MAGKDIDEVSGVDFDPDLVRATLRPLGFAVKSSMAAPTAVAQQNKYLAHYGIDLAAAYPQVRHELRTLMTPNHTLAVHCWRPAQAIGSVLVVHGYFDHVGLYGHLIRHLLDNNFAVLAFDLPGHGLSSGGSATIESFDHYVDALDACVAMFSKQLPQPWHAIGQSMGAAVIMEWLLANTHTRASSPVQKVVLLAPLVRPYLWQLNRLLYLAVRGFIQERPRTFSHNSGDEEFLRFLRERDPLQARALPIQWVRAMVAWKERFVGYSPSDVAPLVIQGQKDRTVDWRYNLRAIGKLFASRNTYLPEARHHLVNESTEIRTRLFTAITEELG